MKKLIVSLVLISASSIAGAQNLTPAQKDSDFRYLASLYSTYYAPIDWKKTLFGFDALAVKPWLDRVAQTATDLDFYEVCVEYVAGLNDTHDHFSLPSDFVASLGFTADVYDGVLLIDSISRTLLPLKDYPFTFGDELLSVDGHDAQQLLKDYAKYAVWANPIATRRVAAARITIRPQSIMPHATDVGDTATVVIRRLNGNVETYTIPWTKTGTPVEVGPVPSPKANVAARRASSQPSVPAAPDYMAELEKARFSGILNPDEVGLNGFGSRSPIFVSALPNAGFTRRLGGSTADFFYSGTFKYDELTLGYIRIPSYSPPSTSVALRQFETEIAFMNANTDGLIVDEMRNPGGNLCFGEEIVARLTPFRFRATGFELRPFWSRILAFYNAMIQAKASGAPQQVIDQYELVFKEMQDANAKGRTLTTSLPLCTSSLTRDPLVDSTGNLIAYRKPITLLIDEFSTSTADSVAGMLADADRATLYGMRTNGAGGNNTSFDAGSYSEGVAGMTLALQTRRGYFWTPDYPVAYYIENVGVWPDFPDNYMTKDNLLQNGAPFVANFLSHAAAYTRGRK